MSIIKALVELSPLSKLLRRGVPLFNQPMHGQSKLFSQSMRLLLCAGLLMSATALQAATWYVSST
ncbi:MAG: hypothetical protein AAB370_01350, partial [Verrucomicrobiota bacterium]